MAGYTYTTLKTAIQDFTDNDEAVFVTELDNFIKNAEERILKTTQLQVFRKNATSSLTVSNKYLAKPTDWLSTYSISILPSSSHVFLLNKDVNFIQEYAPDPTVEGTPKYYADYDLDTFIMAPTPSAADSCEIHYFYRPESLVDASAGTTWLSTNAGPTLLYACLVEAYTFMKGYPDMIAQYEKLYESHIEKLKQFAGVAEGRDSYRIPSA